jgi:hypothetical protein
MLIFFIRKNKKGEPPCQPKNNKDYSQEHNEAMKRFRLFHRKESITASDIITINGNILVTVKRTKLTKHSQN